MANEAIAAEILAMADEDQRLRSEASANTRSWDPEVDKRNARRMREIVSEIGWPTTSKVGAQAEPPRGCSRSTPNSSSRRRALR